MKQCNKCGIEKEINKFRKWRTICRKCEYEEKKKYLLKNPDKLKEWRHYHWLRKGKETNKLWKLNNLDKVKIYRRKDYEKHKEHINIKSKENLYKRYKKFKEQYNIGFGIWQRFGKNLSAKIFNKYNWKCASCGSTKDLSIHHIDHKGRNYQDKGLKANDSEDNLILWCKSCHGKYHAIMYWKEIIVNR